MHGEQGGASGLNLWAAAIALMARSTSLMMTGPAPAFVLLRADGVRVVAFVREQQLRGPGKSLADDSA